jgi:hypothetical protein
MRNKRTMGGFGFNPKAADFAVKPIESIFGGSIPNSIYTSDREASWSRWRRGWEIAVNAGASNNFDYPFTFFIPTPGVPIPPDQNPPQVAGVFKGFPTKNKELGMHWAGVINPGSLRFDNLFDKTTGTPLSNSSVTEDDDYWYVTVAGNWSASNPLPPPLYVPPLFGNPALEPINGYVLEDRLVPGITDADGNLVPITKDTIDPSTNLRLGFTQAILEDVIPDTGVLKLRKRGSVESTIDGILISPARTAPKVGRFLMTGARYCCSCQDFTRRDYFYVSSLGLKKGRFFPRTKVATLKPGRYEIMTLLGKVANGAMTSALENRAMHIVSPNGFNVVDGTVQPIPSDLDVNTTGVNVNRDFPGVFEDFGSVYLRGTSDPSIPGAIADTMPSYNDYKAPNNTITEITDYWTPILDEKRYCKHIYAMKFQEGLFPPEPSDYPVQMGSINDWERKLVEQMEKDQKAAAEKTLRYGLSYMDVPPYNCQAPMMMPMVQKLINIPSDLIRMQGFVMYDKNGTAYVPSTGGEPAV